MYGQLAVVAVIGVLLGVVARRQARRASTPAGDAVLPLTGRGGWVTAVVLAAIIAVTVF
jgi:hypothetical protein